MNRLLRSIVLKFNAQIVCLGRQKIEELELERQRLQEQNNILELRLERHNLQVTHTFCRLIHVDDYMAVLGYQTTYKNYTCLLNRKPFTFVVVS